jgi:ElaB/YqjD/DUF883 family membrane-anchored ribosome-binding protein
MAQRSGDIVSPAAGAADENRDLERYESSTEALERADLEAASAEDADGTEEIKAKIEETRADMGETIDAIQEKLSFANISEQVTEHVNQALETAKDSVYQATIGKVTNFMKNTGKEISRSSIVNTAKDNPLPFILIGVGAGLLAYQGFSRDSRRSSVRYGANPRLMADRSSGSEPWTESAQTGLNSVTGAVSGAAGSVKEGVSSTVGTVRDTVSSAAGSAYEGVTRAASSTYGGVSQLASRAGETATNLGHRASETYEHYLEEKPWAIGAVALVAGAAIGMAIPSTRYEGQLMGEARVNLLNKVSDTASEFVEKAKEAATEVGKTVSDQAKTLTDETVG